MHAGSRSLLPANISSSSRTSESAGCSGASCLLFNMLIIATIALTAVIILIAMLARRCKFSRAVRNGNIPAKMLISYWTVRPSERGDLEAFSFPVHRPLKRDDINEESCPICLKTRSKPSSWIIFDKCNHGTCQGCFKKLADQQRLFVACPMCRALLADGTGHRGGPRPKPETAAQQPAEEQSTSQPAGDNQV